MKKILFTSIVGLMALVPSFSIAQTKQPEEVVINTIEDRFRINWNALEEAALFIGMDGVEIHSAVRYEFLLREKTGISVKEMLNICLNAYYEVYGDSDKHWNQNTNQMCREFVNRYMTASRVDVSEKANDCTAASSLHGKMFHTLNGAYSYRFKTFNDAVRECEIYQKEDYVDGTIYSLCERFREHVKGCTSYLTDYYEDKLWHAQENEKEAGQYECILDLIKTGRINLPVDLMEKECKRK